MEKSEAWSRGKLLEWRRGCVPLTGWLCVGDCGWKSLRRRSSSRLPEQRSKLFTRPASLRETSRSLALGLQSSFRLYVETWPRSWRLLASIAWLSFLRHMTCHCNCSCTKLLRQASTRSSSCAVAAAHRWRLLWLRLLNHRRLTLRWGFDAYWTEEAIHQQWQDRHGCNWTVVIQMD